MPVERRHVTHNSHGSHGGHGSHGKHDHSSSKTPVTKRPASSAKGRRAPSTVTKKKDADTASISSVTSIEKERTKTTEDTVPAKTEQDLTEKEEVHSNGQEDDIRIKTETEEVVVSVEENTDSQSNGNVSKVEPQPETNDEKWAKKSMDGDGFNIRSFNDNILEFTEIFDSDKYQKVSDDYPVEELITVVSQISDTIQEFKVQTQNSQQQLERLREKMKNVKESIHFSVSRNAFEIQTDDEIQSIEERELSEKLAKLNAEVAKANADLSEALRLSAETESTAVYAQLAAQRAKDEAKRIEEEIELRAELAERRKKEEAQRMEEIRKKKEEEERLEEEARKAKDAEWKRRETPGVEKSPVWEKWPVFEMQFDGGDQYNGIACVIRGHPTKFDKQQVTCKSVNQLEVCLPYGAQEELVSGIMTLAPKSDDVKLQESIYVAIPFTISRSSAMSRETFIKAEINGQWQDLASKEITLENHKDQKFVQAEFKTFGTFAVMTRLKRDYVTLSRRSAKITSSFDHRITVSVARETFVRKEHMMMQVQPVDSNSVNELQVKKPECKHLLTSSPIVQMEWETSEFQKPIIVTLSCPPNPAKARKIAQMRKLKEEKMKNPQRIIPVPIDVKEKEEKRQKNQKKSLQEQLAELNAPQEEKKQQTKWYMGDYAHSDDDENDHLYLISQHGQGKWCIQEDVPILQVKLDLLQFELDKPLEKFMVLRVRTNTDPEIVPVMAHSVSEYLLQRFVQVIVKQRSSDVFDTKLEIVPISKTTKTLKRMADEGYEDGPDPSGLISVNEGDTIKISFRGNIQNDDDDEETKFVYNSNVPSSAGFYLSEVDRYLQKNFSMYRGVIQVYRCYYPKVEKKQFKQGSMTDENSLKEDSVCEIHVSIPKYHIEASPVPVHAPVIIKNNTDPVNEEFMKYLASEMGDEWTRVAQTLNISRARMQAIIRLIHISESTDEDARYEMLMTWLKKMPKSLDKVTVLGNALTKCGRGDLADDLQTRYNEFRVSQMKGYVH